ncbi:MAG: hypothetical protein ACKOWD_05905 [Rhodoferax sp.]
MKCWVCSRQAKGFGHVDLRFKVGHPKRYPVDWIFCSRRCQDCFHRLYVVGIRTLEREGRLPTHADLGPGVIDPTEAELAAMEQCLNAFCQILANTRGEITELIPIHPDRVRMELLPSGDYRYRIRDQAGSEIVLPQGRDHALGHQRHSCLLAR